MMARKDAKWPQMGTPCNLRDLLLLHGLVDTTPQLVVHHNAYKIIITKCP